MKNNLHKAKTRPTPKTEMGEPVIPPNDKKPVVTATGKKSRKKLLGSGIGKIWISDDFDSPETNAEITELMLGTRKLYEQ